MKNQLTTTSTQNHSNGVSTVKSCIVHTATSCYLIDNVFARFDGDQAIENGKLIIAMHEAIQKAKSFIEGFEDDDTQTGIKEILEQLNAFNIN